jgi:hypothetical protein
MHDEADAVSSEIMPFEKECFQNLSDLFEILHLFCGQLILLTKIF